MAAQMKCSIFSVNPVESYNFILRDDVILNTPGIVGKKRMS